MTNVRSSRCIFSAVRQAVGSRALILSKYTIATTIQQGLACPYRSIRLRKALGGSAHLLVPSKRESSGRWNIRKGTVLSRADPSRDGASSWWSHRVNLRVLHTASSKALVPDFARPDASISTGLSSTNCPFHKAEYGGDSLQLPQPARLFHPFLGPFPRASSCALFASLFCCRFVPPWLLRLDLHKSFRINQYAAGRPGAICRAELTASAQCQCLKGYPPLGYASAGARDSLTAFIGISLYHAAVCGGRYARSVWLPDACRVCVVARKDLRSDLRSERALT